jgi:hypothetical protein
MSTVVAIHNAVNERAWSEVSWHCLVGVVASQLFPGAMSGQLSWQLREGYKKGEQQAHTSKTRLPMALLLF